MLAAVELNTEWISPLNRSFLLEIFNCIYWICSLSTLLFFNWVIQNQFVVKNKIGLISIANALNENLQGNSIQGTRMKNSFENFIESSWMVGRIFFMDRIIYAFKCEHICHLVRIKLNLGKCDWERRYRWWNNRHEWCKTSRKRFEDVFSALGDKLFRFQSRQNILLNSFRDDKLWGKT